MRQNIWRTRLTEKDIKAIRTCYICGKIKKRRRSQLLKSGKTVTVCLKCLKVYEDLKKLGSISENILQN
jgi:hypothetical protein